MKKRFLPLLAALIILLVLTSSAAAQEYFFRLEQETVHVYWNEDGTLSLDYTLVFTNQPGAHAIEYVDMGMPNDNFDLDSITAEVNGHPILDISRSEYQGSGTGFALGLGSNSIPAGRRGTVHVNIGRITRVLHTDTTDDQYASAVFVPNWFGSQYVTGTTDLTVVFHLPPGVQPDEPRYHTPSGNWPGLDEPETGFDDQGRIIYTWRAPQASAASQYVFGSSFPKSYVPAAAIASPSLFERLGISGEDLIGGLFCLGFAFFIIGMPVITIIADRQRKMKYLPPKVRIEGHGIKRGLTAVEAAILMEQPLDKVMTMILFGVIKKNAARVVKRDPLKIESIPPLPEGMREYERSFVDAFQLEKAGQRQDALQKMTVAMIRSVSDKMKGFSHKETIAYYQNIMEKAWKMVQEADTPEVQSQRLDESLEWTMLDREYDTRTREVIRGPVIIPTWWGRYDPTFGRPASTSGPVPVSTGGGRSSASSLPHLPGSDFAASVVTGVQGFSGKVIGDLTTFTSKVTNVTNPPPKSTSSGGSRSGGGCACACACAGCACACAGGGR